MAKMIVEVLKLFGRWQTFLGAAKICLGCKNDVEDEGLLSLTLCIPLTSNVRPIRENNESRKWNSSVHVI